MQIGYIGLGKMGKNMALRLIEKGHQVVAWNRSPEPRAEVASAGAVTTETVEELVQKMQAPRIVWLMLPAGEVTHQMIELLSGLLSAGDIVIDGGNNHYKEAAAHKELLSTKGVHFFDAGVSGGPAGARNGACVMIGGSAEIYPQIEPLFQDIAAPNAYTFFPGAGAGHFVKMVHNGIEYGMMQAIGEGFEVLKKSSFKLDLEKVAELYNNGSVIESRLIGWLISGYQKNGQELAEISGSVKHSGEGQWTVEAAKELDVPVPIIEGSLQFRIDSTNKPSYTGQVVSVLRNEFGGHEVKK
ncbi:MAG: phosphogluconate dehydrogenase (NAD(+)-dependent, decarboxylating) [Patescibacteria group bacterium]